MTESTMFKYAAVSAHYAAGSGGNDGNLNAVEEENETSASATKTTSSNSPSGNSLIDQLKTGLQEQLHMHYDDAELMTLSQTNADQFHAGGNAATAHLYEKLVAPGGRIAMGEKNSDTQLAGETVMDFGCGLGGPCRQLIHMFPKVKKVIGVDLTAKFVQTANVVNQWKTIEKQLNNRLEISEGDVTSLDPRKFLTASVDKAFCLHVGMNIDDKLKFAAEISRVLKPGGRFVIFEQMLNPSYDSAEAVPVSMLQKLFGGACCGPRVEQGREEDLHGIEGGANGGTASSLTPGNSSSEEEEIQLLNLRRRMLNTSLSYPLPWATDPETSHCAFPSDYVAAFAKAGMWEISELRQDRTVEMREGLEQLQKNMLYHFVTNFTLSPPPLGPTVPMAKDFRHKATNYKKMLEKQLIVLEMVFEK